MHANVSPRTIRHMTAAEGYLELNMPRHALHELDGIDDAGLFEAPRQYMIGHALQTLKRYEEAIPAFEAAARTMPSSHRRFAWKALSECYRECGHDKLAEFAESLSGPPAVRQGKLFLPVVRMTVKRVTNRARNAESAES